MRQLVRSLVQLTIGELLIFIDHGHIVRPLLRLLFKQLMDTLVTWVSCSRIIPLDKKLVTLSRRQNRQLT